ncbi:MAG: helix-turn-helix domain-containing protein [Acidobacteriota bacterium]
MTKRHAAICPIAGFLNIFGDAWSWLVVRESFYGATRFSEYQRNTGIAKNVLSDRLKKLVDAGILSKHDVGERGSRYAYRLTEKGESLGTVLVAMVQWSNDQLFEPGEEPVQLVERDSGEPLLPLTPVDRQGRTLRWRDVIAVPGPGAPEMERKPRSSRTDEPS